MTFRKAHTQLNVYAWQVVLRNDLVTLRPLEPDDFEDLFAVAADPLIWEQHPMKERSAREGFRLFFDEAIASNGAYLIVDHNTQEVIGSSRFNTIAGFPEVIEIGWTFLARKYWGGRYNWAIKKLMIEHALRHAREIIFIVDRNNIRSQRAVEKLGCEKFEGGKMFESRLPEQNFFYRLDAERWTKAMK